MSLLLLTKELQQIKDFVEKQRSILEIDTIDVAIIEKVVEEKTKDTKSYGGIDLVKTLKKSIFFKPIKSKQKIIVIMESHLLTIEAQNALLKLLEEPPLSTQIILHAGDKNTLLPTILSRCTIISLKDSKIIDVDLGAEKEFLDSLIHLPAREALEKAEKLAKNKEEAILFLEKMILATRYELLKSVTDQTKKTNIPFYLRGIRLFQETLTTVKSTNTNLRLSLETLFLSYVQPQGSEAKTPTPSLHRRIQ